MSFFDSSSARRNRQQGGAQPMPGEQRVVRFRDAQMLSAPDTSASVVGLLQSGARVTLLAVADDGRYLRIQTEGGDTGWVDALVLGPAQTAASVPAPAAPPAYAPPIAQPQAGVQAPLAYSVPPQPAPGDAWASPPAQAPTVIAPSAYAVAQPPSGWPAAMQPAAAQQQAPAYPPVQPSAPPAQPGPPAYAPAQQPNVYSYPPAASPAQTAAPAQNSYGYGQPSSAPAQSSYGYPPQQPNYGVPAQRANYGIGGAQTPYIGAVAAGALALACGILMGISVVLPWFSVSGDSIFGPLTVNLSMTDYSKLGSSDASFVLSEVIGVGVLVGVVGLLRLLRVLRIEAARGLFALVGLVALGEAAWRVADFEIQLHQGDTTGVSGGFGVGFFLFAVAAVLVFVALAVDRRDI